MKTFVIDAAGNLTISEEVDGSSMTQTIPKEQLIKSLPQIVLEGCPDDVLLEVKALILNA